MKTKSREVADFLAQRVKSASPSPTVAVSNKARELKAQGIDVIDLGGGDPDFITPEHIRSAATDAMNAGDTHYVASNGTPALKKALAKKLSGRQPARIRSCGNSGYTRRQASTLRNHARNGRRRS